MGLPFEDLGVLTWYWVTHILAWRRCKLVDRGVAMLLRGHIPGWEASSRDSGGDDKNSTKLSFTQMPASKVRSKPFAYCKSYEH
eukprot:4099239-Amphidinium_carterae.1